MLDVLLESRYVLFLVILKRAIFHGVFTETSSLRHCKSLFCVLVSSTVLHPRTAFSMSQTNQMSRIFDLAHNILWGCDDEVSCLPLADRRIQYSAVVPLALHGTVHVPSLI